ncbi:MAG: Asp23/Gls24 family envelope stress response protein [Actinomycetia bacterium]|nr:Asp23/Gls24 family envelope stress response protein [Actinomycetes bacterium]
MSAAQGTGPLPSLQHEQVKLDGITIAPGVVETIVVLAAEETEGVAGVCARSSIRKMGAVPAVDVALDDGVMTCDLHLIAYYGYVLPELGRDVQRNVRHALDAQVGIRPALIDVFFDGIEFED